MHIEITPENLLIQLGYQPTPTLLKQMKTIMTQTSNFSHFSKHLLSLKDELQPIGAFIAMSNSQEYLKVKLESASDSEVSVFVKTLKKWGEKYKVALQKVEGKNTFYILGQN